jgi:hypothetical protein
VKLIRLRKQKAKCSPSYAYYRPETNAAILWDIGHTNRRLCNGRDREREGDQKPEFG